MDTKLCVSYKNNNQYIDIVGACRVIGFISLMFSDYTGWIVMLKIQSG